MNKVKLSEMARSIIIEDKKKRLTGILNNAKKCNKRLELWMKKNGYDVN